jgi:hypothetical protein
VRGAFACTRTGGECPGGGGRSILAVQDLLVRRRITARTGITSCDTRRGLGLLLDISVDDERKFVDGDVGARVRDGRKRSRFTVRLKTDGGVEGDTR